MSSALSVSVAAPDPQDPYVFCASLIRIRIHYYEIRIRIRLRILLLSTKSSMKNLNSDSFVTSSWVFIFEKWCKCSFKKCGNKQKKIGSEKKPEKLKNWTEFFNWTSETHAKRISFRFIMLWTEKNLKRNRRIIILKSKARYALTMGYPAIQCYHSRAVLIWPVGPLKYRMVTCFFIFILALAARR